MQGFGWRNLLHEDFQWKTKKGIQVRWFAYKLPRNGNKKKLFGLGNSRYKLYRNTHVSVYQVYHISTKLYMYLQYTNSPLGRRRYLDVNDYLHSQNILTSGVSQSK